MDFGQLNGIASATPTRPTAERFLPPILGFLAERPDLHARVAPALSALETVEAARPSLPAQSRDVLFDLARRQVETALSGEPFDLVSESGIAVAEWDAAELARRAHQQALLMTRAHVVQSVLGLARDLFGELTIAAQEAAQAYATATKPTAGVMPDELQSLRAGGANAKVYRGAADALAAYASAVDVWKSLRLVVGNGADLTMHEPESRMADDPRAFEAYRKSHPEAPCLQAVTVLGLTPVLDSAKAQQDRVRRIKADRLADPETPVRRRAMAGAEDVARAAM